MSTHSDEIHVPRGPLLGIALLIGITLLAVATFRLSGTEIASRSQASILREVARIAAEGYSSASLGAENSLFVRSVMSWATPHIPTTLPPASRRGTTKA